MAPGDLGRVIGRQGRTAAAMRTLVGATAELEGVKATLEFRTNRSSRSGATAMAAEDWCWSGALPGRTASGAR